MAHIPPSADFPANSPDSSSAPHPARQGPSSSSIGKSQSRRKNHLGGKQITRFRVSYSCHTCRRRKVKCDKVHPVCGNCQKTGAECRYDPTSLSESARSRREARDRSEAAKRRRDIPAKEEQILDDMICGGDGLAEIRDLPAVEQNDPKPDNQEIATRLSRLTSMIEKLSRTDTSQSMQALNTVAQEESAGARSAAATESSRSGSRQQSPRRDVGGNGSDEFPVAAGRATDPVDPVGTLNLGHLSLEDGGKSRYVGTTYFAYISDEINELNQLLREQNRIHEKPQTSSEYLSPDEGGAPGTSTYHGRHKGSWSSVPDEIDQSLIGDSPGSQETTLEPDMLQSMPTKRQSHILYKSFMSGVHAISPVLHPPSILKLYDSFWEWYEHRGYSGDPCPDPSFIPLLYAMWYGGSVTVSLRTVNSEFGIECRADLSALFHDEVTRWLKAISFPRNPTLNGLSAFLLVQTILSKEEEPLTSSLFISLALRVAQTMGLHRDPAQFGITGSEAETRRRVWWHIVHMDGVVAMSSGLPPLVSDENYWDVRLTSEVKDTLVGTPAAEEYDRAVNEGRRAPDRPDDPTLCGGSSMVNVYYLSAKGKYVMARAIRRILKIQLGTKPVTRKDVEDLRLILIDLQNQLLAIVNRIPVSKISDFDHQSIFASESKCFSGPDLPNGGPGCMEQFHSPVLVAFHKWARTLLLLFINKAFCVAYQPFLKNAKSKIWPSARQCALRHCHGFMEKFISFATDPDFQPFQWSWPGNHQPMHATMIMLIDLYERPNTPEAPKSRAFIDKVFSLSGPDGGVVGGEDGITTSRPLRDGGREAWDMMRRLREKAWLKAGLDPQILWTEHAQHQAGVNPNPYPGLSRQGSYPAKTPREGRGARAPSFVEDYYSLIKDPTVHTNSRLSPSASTQQHISPEPTAMLQSLSPQSPTSGGFRDFAERQAHTTFPLQQQQQQQQQQQPIQDFAMPPLPPYQTSAPQGTSTNQNQGQNQNPMFSSTRPFPNVDPSAANHNNFTDVFTSADPIDPMSAYFAANPNSNQTSTPQASASAPGPVPAPVPVPSGSNTATNTNRPSRPQAPQQQQQQQRNINLSANLNPLDPSNVNFDWEEWDAFFGQYLPVADGLMDLDGGAAVNTPTGMGQGGPGSDPTASGQGRAEFGGVELGMGIGMDAGSTGDGNWVNFG